MDAAVAGVVEGKTGATPVIVAVGLGVAEVAVGLVVALVGGGFCVTAAVDPTVADCGGAVAGEGFAVVVP